MFKSLKAPLKEDKIPINTKSLHFSDNPIIPFIGRNVINSNMWTVRQRLNTPYSEKKIIENM